MSGTSTRAPFPGLSDTEKTHHKGEIGYPNLLLSVAAEHVAAFVLWPMAPDHTRIACDFLFHVSEIGEAGLRSERRRSSSGTSSTARIGRSARACSAGMQSRGFRGGFYAPMEDPSLDIRRYLEQHLGDLSRVG